MLCMETKCNQIIAKQQKYSKSCDYKLHTHRLPCTGKVAPSAICQLIVCIIIIWEINIRAWIQLVCCRCCSSDHSEPMFFYHPSTDYETYIWSEGSSGRHFKPTACSKSPDLCHICDENLTKYVRYSFFHRHFLHCNNALNGNVF